ncbi:MAG: ATP-binding protein [Pseudomonadota bacterium]|nr:ATP-binding protein [Pseudomonadota bacterium]
MIRLDSIQSRLTQVALVIIIGSSLAVGLAGFRLTGRFLSREFHQSFKLLAGNMAGNAELGIMIDDRKMLDRLVKTMLSQQYVKGAAVFDNANQMLAQAGMDNKNRSYGETTISITAPIRSLQMRNEALIISESSQYETVGHVELRYSLSGLEQLKATIARQFFFISIVLVLAAVFIYWLMARLIAAPLKDLVEVSHQVSQGQMDVRARGGRFHETRILATTFNEMLTALGHQRQELRQMYEEMNRQQTLAEVGKFSLMMAHEVKNPLAIIRGSLDLLKKDDCDEKTKASLYIYLDEEINRINRLMEDFLLFARPKAPSLAQEEMGELVRNLTKRMELAGENQQLKIETRIAPEPCMVSCDIQLLERAMGNLVKNAMEVSRKSQPVTISSGTEGDRWYFCVEDRGPGIKPENLAKIFTPFFTTKAKGTGLGLAITREIINAHGGKIGAENRKDGGAVFSFWIPWK